MPLQLPTAPLAPTNLEPSLMLLSGPPKLGKTSATLQLPNSFLIDLEGSATKFGGNYINLIEQLPLINHERKLAKQSPVGLGTLYFETIELIKTANIDAGKPVYDFLILDNTSVIGELAYPLATKMYKETLAGKNFRGSDVTAELPMGAGWNWYSKAFLSLVKPLESLANKCVIILAHTKNTEVTKNGYGTFSITDLEISGNKSKASILRNCDTQGLLVRAKELTDDGRYQNMITFRSRDEGDIIGCRSPYLANKDIIISDWHPETYEVRTYWERIFPSIKG